MKKKTKQESEFLTSLGTTVRAIRKQKGRTLQEIAALCNAEKANFSRLETGKLNPQILTLKKIADSLQVPLMVLLPSSTI